MKLLRQREFGLRDNIPDEIALGDLVLRKTYPLKFLQLIEKIIKKYNEKAQRLACYTIYKNNKSIGDFQIYDNLDGGINIVWIGIKESYRGNGYATKVLNYLIKTSKEQGYKYMDLEVPGKSPDAKHIYEKLGFREVYVIDTPEEDELWGGLTKMKLKLK